MGLKENLDCLVEEDKKEKLVHMETLVFLVKEVLLDKEAKKEMLALPV